MILSSIKSYSITKVTLSQLLFTFFTSGTAAYILVYVSIWWVICRYGVTIFTDSLFKFLVLVLLFNLLSFMYETKSLNQRKEFYDDSVDNLLAWLQEKYKIFLWIDKILFSLSQEVPMYLNKKFGKFSTFYYIQSVRYRWIFWISKIILILFPGVFYTVIILEILVCGKLFYSNFFLPLYFFNFIYKRLLRGCARYFYYQTVESSSGPYYFEKQLFDLVDVPGTSTFEKQRNLTLQYLCFRALPVYSSLSLRIRREDQRSVLLNLKSHKSYYRFRVNYYQYCYFCANVCELIRMSFPSPSKRIQTSMKFLKISIKLTLFIIFSFWCKWCLMH